MNIRCTVRAMSVLVALVMTLTFATAASYGQHKSRAKTTTKAKSKAKPKPKYKSDVSPYAPKPQPAACVQYTKISECPLEGCGGDEEKPELNQRKNDSTANLGSAQDTEFEVLRTKEVPADYVKGGDRKPQFTDEGDVVRTVAFLTDIRWGSQESCNCKLSKPEDTDNHMVLISSKVINKWKPKDWEKHSFTAEFTPRVKAKGHPNFRVSVVDHLIKDDPRGRLMVRLTGTMMFDDYHEEHPLAKGRETNWEIHPVFRFEYCLYKDRNICTLDSSEGWKNIDD